MSEPLLQVRELITAFETDAGLVRAVDQVSFEIERGKTLGIVGESGCGKSVTAMSIVRLLPQPAGKILQGEVSFKGRDLTRLKPEEIRKVRGNEIGVIFQEPMTALNPVHRIGKQLAECFIIHKGMSKKDAWAAGIEMLRLVKIPAPELRAGDYPHQLSGGMRQRVVIAMALALRPDLVIADEPTTALDVTVQAQILDLMKRLQAEMGMSLMLITHDLGVIAETCDEVVVMYAGRVVERAPVKELFERPLHAYTRGLLASIPRMDTPRKSILPVIPGMVAALKDLVPGCRFCQRMDRQISRLLRERPPFIEVSPGHWVEACPTCYASNEA
ncbi:ABC transporter ATP-binding protein [Luteolibacter sp. GHJ8]|jgi:peptide/nickel transport system ATP-binding protein|uniref:ABC transporter ATP-binding protein n=1 Tax=Luteolibacter rhizosphaerae TaxID=2989719 RepID=A0ABT3G8T7_9BACT|nr:ABC transporter ATP-binding protein [Luteolibacter rhizosphaerae]MCW1916014.1 ABC transporter ATP-binding protein [Luteolibacter rhizosphaerae]